MLAVSTDPAHSLGDALAVPLSARPRPVGTRRGRLGAAELDADRALARWLARRRPALRTLVSRGTYLDEGEVDRFLDLALPGVDELMGLVELTRLAGAGPWEAVVVDTAPTGHTLRLLAMPDTLGRIAALLDGMQARHRFLAESLGGRRLTDGADALVGELEGLGRDLGALLTDPRRCRVSWVLLPEALALAETRDGVGALREAGLAVDEIVVNRLTARPPGRCRLGRARAGAEAEVLAAVRAAFPDLALRAVPDLGREPRGPAALRRVAGHLARATRASPRSLDRVRAPGLITGQGMGTRASPRPCPAGITAGGDARARSAARLPLPSTAVMECLVPRGVRLVLFAGKGGVGKTSCAAATALALAEGRGARILLLSADPAHSLADVLDHRPGGPAAPAGEPGPLARPARVPTRRGRLQALEVDAAAALVRRRRRFREAIDALFDRLRGGSRFEATFDRAVARDLIELAPPGIDELFGVLAVVEALAPAGDGAGHDTVVLDTAPTGHALRLLALPGAARGWLHELLALLLRYRQVIGLGELGADVLEASRDFRRLHDLLRDPAHTRLIAVSRPAALPRLETARLLRAARRLGIPTGPLLVNAVTPPDCPACRRTAAAEAPEIAALARHARSPGPGPCAMILAPTVAPPPRGGPALLGWSAAWTLGRGASRDQG